MALKKALGETPPFDVVEDDLRRVLGPPAHPRDRVDRTCTPGVAMGLAWTPAGGQVLFIEASAVPGRGSLKLTGSLGDVMKESAEAATTWLREHAPGFGSLLEMDIHVHVPEGAVPKDGPSAGVALLLAIASAVTGRVIRHDLACTGEITLRGQVLRVGGIREKVMAAQQAGVRALILPKRNAADLSEVPPEILAAMDIHLVERVEEALGPALATNDGCPVVPPPAPPRLKPPAKRARRRPRRGKR
jgi:ATP-dependent Lon protease